ncbi:MAG: NAD-dependent epimerase/dehydratase family protein [Rhodobacteraceae bacterium]|jgi:UDP-glucose 4-epimerase|nr:NAD-dependent epimerase/dehydratase family protein [Paracoccaceae bacterium]
MKVLVLGGCGFIGSHVVDALLARGLSVRVFDRRPEAYRAPLHGVDYRYGSFSDRMAVIDALAGVDAVIHLISTTFPGTANLDPATDVQDNLVGTITLLESMLSLGVHRIVFLSSGGTVYGVPDTVPIPETHPLRPINSYGIVKVAIESYLNMYGRLKGLSPVILRATNPYGPRQAHVGVQGVVSTFLRRVRDGEALDVWGDGTVTRDFIYVADLAALCAAVTPGETEGIFNAGSGVGASVNDIIAEIAAVSGTAPVVNYKSARAIDVPRSVLDVSLARETFGWQATTLLREGIARTWEWLGTSD